MANVLIKEESLFDIAQTIRDILGTDDKYKPNQMSGAVDNVFRRGLSLGYDDGKFEAWNGYWTKTMASATIPEGIDEIPRSFFDNQRNLETVTLPSTLKLIRQGAFMGCSNLSSINLPEGLTLIGDSAFESANLGGTLIIPSTVTTIGDYTFSYPSDRMLLTEVIFKGTPREIGENAFWDNIGLTSIKVPWSEGAVAGAPWGALEATITYDWMEE